MPTKVHLVKAVVYPVVMYGCESWTIEKAECWRIAAFWTVLLEKTIESPLDIKEIQPVHPKGNQSWMFIGRTDAEAETPILWPPNGKNWLIWKDPDAGKDWRCEEKGMIEDEMVGWHYWFNGHEVESTMGVGDGQGGLVCCSPRGCEESDTSEWLNWADNDMWASQVVLLVKNSPASVGDVRCKRGEFSLCVGKIPWRRAWQLLSVFLPGESHGQRNLLGWGRRE